MMPVLDSAVRDVLTLASPNPQLAEQMFLTAPVRWIDGEDGDLTALGVGTVKGIERREVLATLHSHAAQNAFPGMSRQNTQQNAFASLSRQSTTQLQPRPSEPSVAPLIQPAVHPVQQAAPPVFEAPSTNPPTTFSPPQAAAATAFQIHQPPSMQPVPAPTTNGIENSRPGQIEMPKAPLDRTTTDFFTPPAEPAELKRL